VQRARRDREESCHRERTVSRVSSRRW
jgi:hypothetical protein